MADGNSVKHENFFSYNARYSVDPNADSSQLLNDVHCWLDAAMEIVNTVACGLDGDGDMAANPKHTCKLLWGAYHLLQMAQGGTTAAHGHLPREASHLRVVA